MILVTVGTHNQQFNRLVKAADDLALLIDEQVMIQRGVSDYLPKNADFIEIVSLPEIEELVSRSRIVIAQAGAGTAITVFKFKKPLIMVPRLSKYGENHNDHQTELAGTLESQNRAVCIVEPSGELLLQALIEVETQTNISSQQLPPLIQAIQQQLKLWDSD